MYMHSPFNLLRFLAHPPPQLLFADLESPVLHQWVNSWVWQRFAPDIERDWRHFYASQRRRPICLISILMVLASGFLMFLDLYATRDPARARYLAYLALLCAIESQSHCIARSLHRASSCRGLSRLRTVTPNPIPTCSPPPQAQAHDASRGRAQTHTPSGAPKTL